MKAQIAKTMAIVAAVVLLGGCATTRESRAFVEPEYSFLEETVLSGFDGLDWDARRPSDPTMRQLLGNR